VLLLLLPWRRLGANVKVINCVLMDGVVIGDGSHIQNSIICSGAAVQERCSLKDCQVGGRRGWQRGCAGSPGAHAL
jgi:NDP-sugar pyrophosphorylase family protein